VNNGGMRLVLAPILTGALIATCVAQPALAKPCTYPMTRASAQPQTNRQAPTAPRAKESRNPPCTILQKWVPDATS
jgi:hypothetical protein